LEKELHVWPYAWHGRGKPIVDDQGPKDKEARSTVVADAIGSDLVRIKKRDRAEGAGDDGRRHATNKVGLGLAVT
jgi:hypothetical protein